MPLVTDSLATALIAQHEIAPDWWKRLWSRCRTGNELREAVATRKELKCGAVHRFASEGTTCCLDSGHPGDWHMRWDGWDWKGSY